MCAEKQVSRLPLRLTQSLRIRYILGPAAPAQLGEVLERTWTQPLASGWGLVQKESVLNFVLARPLSPLLNDKPKRWQLPRLPQRLPRRWLKKKAVFLGVDPILCRPVYATLHSRQHLGVLSLIPSSMSPGLTKRKSSRFWKEKRRLFWLAQRAICSAAHGAGWLIFH